MGYIRILQVICFLLSLVTAADSSIQVSNAGEICRSSFVKDLQYKYFAYFSDWRPAERGVYWQSVVTVDALGAKGTVREVDVTVSATYPAVEMTNLPGVGSTVSFLPLMTNITSGDDLSMRYFYEGKCLTDTCDSV